jgi:transcriptional regulator with XRE-family HTH domain
MTPTSELFPGTMQGLSFGDVLRWFRVQRMYSQAELAERSGLREKSISALETGLRSRPHFSTLRALAEALALSEAERSTLLAATQHQPKRAARDRMAAHAG